MVQISSKLVRGMTASLLIMAATLFAASTRLLADDAKPADTGTVIEAESGVLAGGLQVQQDDAASGGNAVGCFHIGGASLTFNNVDGGKGGAYKMKITYSTPDDSSTSLYVNTTPPVKVDFPKTAAWSGAGAYKDVVVSIVLVAGKKNTIKFETDDGNGAVNLDKLTLTVDKTAPAKS